MLLGVTLFAKNPIKRGFLAKTRREWRYAPERWVKSDRDWQAAVVGINGSSAVGAAYLQHHNHHEISAPVGAAASARPKMSLLPELDDDLGR